MKRTSLLAFLLTILLLAPAQANTVLLSDDFTGSAMNANWWRIPTWTSPTDGTYVGRTQFMCTQSFGLPQVSNGVAAIVLNTYNNRPNPQSFYGADLISKQLFSVGPGMLLTVRARMDAPLRRGVVGGIFLYALKPGSNTLHDEIDFEILGNRPDGVQTNVYANEPLGAGHPVFSKFATGSATDDHVYQVLWEPDKVTWFVDGTSVRTETVHVPQGAMYMHLNMWAPASDWAAAYDASLQPTNVSATSQTLQMSVDRVKLESMISSPSAVVQFTNQRAVLVTNLPNYPVLGVSPEATQVTVNGAAAPLADGGYRYDVTLQPGSNTFTVMAKNASQVLSSEKKTVIYNPAWSTEDQQLLYVVPNSTVQETFVINLTGGYLLGLLPGRAVHSASPDGAFVTDESNWMISAATGKQGAQLPFSSGAYPLYSGTGVFAYAGRQKVKVKTGQVLSSGIPLPVDARFSSLLTDGRIAVFSAGEKKISLMSDTAISAAISIPEMAYYANDGHVDPTGTYAVAASTAGGGSTINLIKVKTGYRYPAISGLPDWANEITFTPDGRKALIGAHGNAYYGGGGVYVLDLATGRIKGVNDGTNAGNVDGYNRYGAGAVLAARDNYVYTTSCYTQWTASDSRTIIQGEKDHRGVDVLRLDSGARLQFVRSFFLNTTDRSDIGHCLFLKPIPPPNAIKAWAIYH